MALTSNIEVRPQPFVKELLHKFVSITDGNSAALIAAIVGKRIRIWRLHTYAGTTAKHCAFLSGSNDFPWLDTTKTLSHELKSSDGIPVFTCNISEAFNADPSDTTNWYFYIVYSVE